MKIRGKSIFETRNQNFCYIQVIVFDFCFLSVKHFWYFSQFFHGDGLAKSQPLPLVDSQGQKQYLECNRNSGFGFQKCLFPEFKLRRRDPTMNRPKWINCSKGINGSKRGFERTRSWKPFWINSVFETVLETDLETVLRNVRLIWLGKTGKSSFSGFLSSSIIPLRVFKKRLYCFNTLLEF